MRYAMGSPVRPHAHGAPVQLYEPADPQSLWQGLARAHACCARRLRGTQLAASVARPHWAAAAVLLDSPPHSGTGRRTGCAKGRWTGQRLQPEPQLPQLLLGWWPVCLHIE